jgi:hypothetical protein
MIGWILKQWRNYPLDLAGVFSISSSYTCFYMISKWSGIYGKRWLCETMISVIKRKFGDSIRERERKWKSKKTLHPLWL